MVGAICKQNDEKRNQDKNTNQPPYLLVASLLIVLDVLDR